MPQYAVFMYEKETPGGVDDIPEDVMQGHMTLPDRVADKGGRIFAGLAFEPTSASTAVRGDVVTDGPFIESKEAIAGVYLLEARDLDHALELVKLTPIVSGGVEVRPLFDFQVT